MSDAIVVFQNSRPPSPIGLPVAIKLGQPADSGVVDRERTDVRRDTNKTMFWLQQLARDLSQDLLHCFGFSP